jgi:uncharacterized protein YbjT (DUF2867 family)
MTSQSPILVLGAHGKTGSRVASRLTALDLPVRPGSRSLSPRFEWTAPSTWPAALDGVRAAYITYQPDLAVPGSAEDIANFADQALALGVRRLVLLSGRGEDEAQRAEDALIASGAAWTVIRSSWLDQNFSESFMLDLVRSGEVVLPVGNVGEPFIDAEDIADVAIAALTDDRHIGMLYEVSGPELLSFNDAVTAIATATGRDIRLMPVSGEDFRRGLLEDGVPSDIASFLDYLFRTVLDGRNARVADGVQRALGREPRTFADYVAATIRTGVWDVAAEEVA